jgi:transcription initiation factor TFIIB
MKKQESNFVESVVLLFLRNRKNQVQNGDHFKKIEGQILQGQVHHNHLQFTTINKDASGKPLTTSMKSTIERLRTWDSRSQVHEPIDRNLRQALGELNKLKDKVTVSANVLEKAAYIYRKALEKKLVRGRSISAMIAASLYAACRDAETPRTLKDVADAANVKRKDIARCYRLLYHELELKMPVVDSVQCIARISSKLEIPEKTKRHAVKVLQEAQDRKESAGKDPMGLAATALYLACVKNGVSITQRDLAEAAGVTEVTIRNRYKGLKADQTSKANL